MSELLAHYWFNATRIPRKSKTSYISLYDNGRSANIIVIMGGCKVHVPKWLMRDFISLSFVAYPNQRFVRRSPYHVEIMEELEEILADAGLHYDPGGLRGTVRTNISEVPIDPKITLDPESRTNLARMGNHNDMIQMISDDITQSGANVSKMSGIEKVRKEYGWTTFEVVMTAYVMGKDSRER